MSPDYDAFRAGYRDAFRSYLNGGGETGLESAYGLGRAAVTGELSLLELARIHHEVLAESLGSAPPGELARVARAGTDFFLEGLSSFEMIRRGFEEAQETARLQQRHADQLRGLADAALAVNSTLSVDEMLERIGERASAIIGAERSTVHVAANGADAPERPLRDGDRLAAPLIDRGGRPRGLIALSGKREGEFTEDDESILVQLAHMASVAIENASLYEHERGIARMLQKNLLPQKPPKVPGVMTCWRYLAPGDEVEVGGDWYEVLPLPGGRVGVAIGDVVGRGVGAAAMMGHIRIALRAYALEDESPAHVARRTAGFVRTLGRDQMSTCVYAVLDPATGELCSANAGHPPPIVLSSEGRAGFLAGKPGLPFGVAEDSQYPEARARLEPDGMLLLYTDGLVEKRGESIDAGLERLRAAAEGSPADPAVLCERVLDALVEGGRGDDVAVLAVRYVPREGPA